MHIRRASLEKPLDDDIVDDKDAFSYCLRGIVLTVDRPTVTVHDITVL